VVPTLKSIARVRSSRTYLRTARISRERYLELLEHPESPKSANRFAFICNHTLVPQRFAGLEGVAMPLPAFCVAAEGDEARARVEDVLLADRVR